MVYGGVSYCVTATFPVKKFLTRKLVRIGLTLMWAQVEIKLTRFKIIVDHSKMTLAISALIELYKDYYGSEIECADKAQFFIST